MWSPILALWSPILALFFLLGFSKACLPPPRPPPVASSSVSQRLDSGSSLSSLPCGLQGGSSRILGQVAGKDQFPWAVAVLAGNSRSSGSIISPHYVLTCGHCLPPSAQTVLVVPGGRWSDLSQARTATNSWRHPSYTDSDLTWDIGLIELETPFTFSSSLSPVCLSRDSVRGGDRVALLGWINSGSSSQQLGYYPDMEVWVGVTSFGFDCREGNHKICYQGGNKIGEGGDSGGVMMKKSQSTGRWFQVGVHSHGAGGYDADIRVAAYMDWILQETGARL